MRAFRAVSIFAAGMVALAGSSGASAALVGTSISTGIAALKEWNLVAFNNFSSQNHVDGRVLVGNNFTAGQNFAVLNNNVPSSSYGTSALTVGNTAQMAGSINAAGVQVGGNLSGSFNNNGNGAVQVGGTAQSQQNFTVQSGLGQNFTNTLLNQSADIKQSLTSLSANLAALANSGTVALGGDSNNQTLVVTGTGLSVFNMTEAQFEGNSNQQLLVTVPSGATLVVNVAGTDIDFNRTLNRFTNDSNVIWNFYQATTVDIARQFSGSVLGVFADITGGNSGNIDGSVVGNNVFQNANGEIHNVYFQGDLSSVGGGVVSTAPEPSTWAMLLLGFGLIGAVLRRRRSRTLATQAI